MMKICKFSFKACKRLNSKSPERLSNTDYDEHVATNSQWYAFVDALSKDILNPRMPSLTASKTGNPHLPKIMFMSTERFIVLQEIFRSSKITWRGRFESMFSALTHIRSISTSAVCCKLLRYRLRQVSTFSLYLCKCLTSLPDRYRSKFKAAP